MAELPKYALPLVVRYQTLLALIRKNMNLAVKDSARGSSTEMMSRIELPDLQRDIIANTPLMDRCGALNNLLFKLRHWANKLDYESPKKVIAGPDVLEALEASNLAVIIKVHVIFSDIANKLGEQTSK